MTLSSKIEDGTRCYLSCATLNFGESVTALELAPDGRGYRMHTRFARFVNLPELMSMFGEVADSATGIGSYTTTKTAYNAKLKKWVTTTTVTPYGLFNVVFACAGDALAKVTVTIAVGAQCHWGGCNSDYYPLTLNFIPGRNTATSGYQARVYDGTLWHLTSITYNGTTNTVSLSTAAMQRKLNNYYTRGRQ